jgi:[protein-PII] uridylyltransferase
MVDGDKLAVEQFMQVYYRWMKTLSQLNELLIEVFEHRLAEVQMTSRFRCARHR